MLTRICPKLIWKILVTKRLKYLKRADPRRKARPKPGTNRSRFDDLKSIIKLKIKMYNLSPEILKTLPKQFEKGPVNWKRRLARKMQPL